MLLGQECYQAARSVVAAVLKKWYIGCTYRKDLPFTSGTFSAHLQMRLLKHVTGHTKYPFLGKLVYCLKN